MKRSLVYGFVLLAVAIGGYMLWDSAGKVKTQKEALAKKLKDYTITIVNSTNSPTSRL